MRSLLVSIVVLAGCYSPKITNGGLVCSASSTCPSGYDCASDKHCWKPGTGPTSGDMTSVDQMSTDLAGADLVSSPDDMSPGGDAAAGCGICSGYCVGATCMPFLTLTVTNGATDSATVASEDGHISCGALCSYGQYKVGDVVTLHPGPKTGVNFTGWSGGGCTGTGNCTITMTADTTVSTTYGVVLTLIVEDDDSCPGSYGAGATATPTNGAGCFLSGSNGPTTNTKTCTYNYGAGADVTITAVPASGSRLDSPFMDGCNPAGATSTAASCATTLSASKTITVFCCHS